MNIVPISPKHVGFWVSGAFNADFVFTSDLYKNKFQKSATFYYIIVKKFKKTDGCLV